MSEEGKRSVLREKYEEEAERAFYTTREIHPSCMAEIILIGRKYKIENSTAKVIPALINYLKFFLSTTKVF